MDHYYQMNQNFNKKFNNNFKFLIHFMKMDLRFYLKNNGIF